MQNTLESNILLYKTAQGETRIEVIFNNETFWMSQKRMAALFGVDRATITYHISQIYESGELQREATCRKFNKFNWRESVMLSVLHCSTILM